MSEPKNINNRSSSQATITPEDLDILAGIGRTDSSGVADSVEPSLDETLDYFDNPQTLPDQDRQKRLESSVVKLFTTPPEDPRRKAAVNAEKAIAEAEAIETLAGDAGLEFSAANLTDRITDLREELYSKDLTDEDIEAVNAELEALYLLCGSVHGALAKYIGMPEAETGTGAAEGLKDLLTLLDEFSVNPSEDVLAALGETGEDVAKELTLFELKHFIIPSNTAKETFNETTLEQISKVQDPSTRANLGFAMIEGFYNNSDIPDYAKASPDALLARFEEAGILDDATLKAAGLDKLSKEIKAIGRDIRTGRLTQEEGNERILIRMGEAAVWQASKVRNRLVTDLEDMVLKSVDLNAGKEEAKRRYVERSIAEQRHLQGSSASMMGNPILVGTAKSRSFLEKEFEEMWSGSVAEQESEWRAAVRMAAFEVRSDLGNEINGLTNSVSFGDMVERREKLSKMMEEDGGKNSMGAFIEGTLLAKTFLSGRLLAKEVAINDNVAGTARDYASASFGLDGASLMEIARLDKRSSVAAIKGARLKMEARIEDISRAVVLADGYGGIAKFSTTVGIIILASMSGGFAAQAAVELGAVAEGGVGAFFVDATAFGLADTALTAVVFKKYPKTFGEFAVKMAHTYATFGALRGTGKVGEPFVGSAKEGYAIINNAEKMAGKLTARELRSVSMVLGGCPSVWKALAIDAAQIVSSHATLQVTSAVLGTVGIGEVPEGFGTWEDILTLAILHYHGKMKGHRERIFTGERVEHKEPAILTPPTLPASTPSIEKLGEVKIDAVSAQAGSKVVAKQGAKGLRHDEMTHDADFGVGVRHAVNNLFRSALEYLTKRRAGAPKVVAKWILQGAVAADTSVFNLPLLDTASGKMLAEIFVDVRNPNIEQQSTGDCYLLAYIHALMRKPYAMHLLSRMIERVDGGWNVKFENYPEKIFVPIDSVGPRWVRDESTGRYVHKQLSVGDMGVKILEAAFGKLSKKIHRRHASTRSSTLFAVESGTLSEASEAFMGNLATRDVIAVMEGMDRGTRAQLRDVFSRYSRNPGQIILYAGSLRWRPKDAPWWFSETHAYDVVYVDLKHDLVAISNPHKARDTIWITMKEFYKYFATLQYEIVDVEKVNRLFVDAVSGPLDSPISTDVWSAYDVTGYPAMIKVDGTPMAMVSVSREGGLLVDLSPSGVDRVVRIEKYEKMDFGRADFARLAVVSDRHFSLMNMGDGGFYIEDLGSTNGTVVTSPRADNFSGTLLPQENHLYDLRNGALRLYLGSRFYLDFEKRDGGIMMQWPTGERRFLVEGEWKVLGRDNAFGEPTVSAEHAFVKNAGGLLRIWDLGSTNGTTADFR